jgi:hypothetical protein
MRMNLLRPILATALLLAALSTHDARSAPTPAPTAPAAAAADDDSGRPGNCAGKGPDVEALEGMRTGVEISLGLFLLLLLSTGGLLGVRAHRCCATTWSGPWST